VLADSPYLQPFDFPAVSGLQPPIDTTSPAPSLPSGLTTPCPLRVRCGGQSWVTTVDNKMRRSRQAVRVARRWIAADRR